MKQNNMPQTSSAKNDSFLENTCVINGSVRALWHKSAPAAVRRAFSSGNHADGWNAWKRHLASRHVPPEPATLLPGSTPALGWALPEGLDKPQHLRQYPNPDDPAVQKELLEWLGEVAGRAPDAGCALEALAWCHTLPALAAGLSPEVWWGLLEVLLGAAGEAARIEPEANSRQADPLVHQLTAGELALTLAYLLPEITPCRKLGAVGRRVLSSGLVDLLDGEGLPQARDLPLLRPLLACWTRCRALGGQLEGGCWTAAAENQYQWLVRQALRLVRHDGTHVFSNRSAGRWSAELFQAALQFGSDEDDDNIAALVLPQQDKKTGGKRISEAALPQPAIHSEWAATAVLRPRWSRTGERLTVLYPEQWVKLELGCGKDVLFSGTWELEVRIDGRPAVPASAWEEVCWESDEEVDYLELEIGLTDGLRVQRHFALARQDHFLLLADAILGRRRGALEYRGCLPLCPGISFQGAEQTREGFLVGRKPRGSVLPLALPEWRVDVRTGELTQTEQGLELRQWCEGPRLFAPLFFDLDRRRMARRLTWRQLTVAESLEIQPSEVAVGYRVAAGKHQWLIYRSLAQKANRTLLGHNLSTEMLLARFHRCGEVEPLVEIE